MFPGETATSTNEVNAHFDTLRRLVNRLDPLIVPLPDAPRPWQAFNSIERLAAAAQTLLAPRVDESKAWERAGYRSAAEYLARRSGSSPPQNLFRLVPGGGHRHPGLRPTQRPPPPQQQAHP
jgi:hypothetical protein